MNDLLDIEDDLHRLNDQLVLLLMATQALEREESAALYQGIAEARARTGAIGERVQAIRQGAA